MRELFVFNAICTERPAPMNDRQRKDRLIQTRVPQDLESTLKDEARKRRLSVSHLIRNVLEDTFNLVDNVVVEVDRVVSDSVEMAKTLQRDAQRLAATARGETKHREPPPPPVAPEVIDVPSRAVNVTDATEAALADDEAALDRVGSGPLAHVYAWQELTLNRPAQCARCQVTLARGERGHLGLTEARDMPKAWLCQSCLEAFDQDLDDGGGSE